MRERRCIRWESLQLGDPLRGLTGLKGLPGQMKNGRHQV